LFDRFATRTPFHLPLPERQGQHVQSTGKDRLLQPEITPHPNPPGKDSIHQPNLARQGQHPGSLWLSRTGVCQGLFGWVSLA